MKIKKLKFNYYKDYYSWVNPVDFEVLFEKAWKYAAAQEEIGTKFWKVSLSKKMGSLCRDFGQTLRAKAEKEAVELDTLGQEDNNFKNVDFYTTMQQIITAKEEFDLLLRILDGENANIEYYAKNKLLKKLNKNLKAWEG